uniref:Glycosyltransferase family 4 protein n=1 Tax=Roseihalotalea indica TaxID=2867963 RepID=A0AA49GGK5_9BACT|nr:glycosyltransferase family 4 protein [Tunicatimonas sp. TK19036]
MSAHWYFVLPEARNQPSGGNIYNERLLAALKQAGKSISIISVNDYINAVQHDRAGIYWVDTLVLEHLSALLSLRPKQACSLLITHHLDSMSPADGQSSAALLSEEKPLVSWFQGFLATSTFTRDYLRQHGFSQPILVVEPGITVSKMAALPRDTGTIRALMVANVVERKGILPWLQQLAQGLQPTDSFSITIVGRSDIEPQYANRCHQFIREHPLLNRRVQFAGSQPPGQMPLFYQQANLLVSTAMIETFGMALQEARAYQLPILALKGGYSEQHIISGENGYVFEHLPDLRDFFLDMSRDTSKFAILYHRTQQQSSTFTSWKETVDSLFQQFDQFFTHAP